MKTGSNFRARVVATFVAALLVGCAIVFLSIAAYLALLSEMSRVQAALAVAASCLLLVLAGWLLRRFMQRRRPPRTTDNPWDVLEEAMQTYAHPVLKNWAVQHPDRAALLSVLLGVVAGYSPSARRSINALFEQLTRAERER